jgi:hypothetical protein
MAEADLLGHRRHRRLLYFEFAVLVGELDMTEKRDVETAELSIWFFCGILMLAYGLILVVTGITEIHNPPPTVLAELQPTLWWGVLMTLFGSFYTIRFRPKHKLF